MLYYCTQQQHWLCFGTPRTTTRRRDSQNPSRVHGCPQPARRLISSPFTSACSGKLHKKPTSILYCSQSLGLVAQCDHQPSMQRWTESNGKLQSAWRRHPPLVDCLVDGKPATKQAAAYPFRMNLLLAKAITASERANSLLAPPLDPPFLGQFLAPL